MDDERGSLIIAATDLRKRADGCNALRRDVRAFWCFGCETVEEEGNEVGGFVHAEDEFGAGVAGFHAGVLGIGVFDGVVGDLLGG